MDSLQRPAPWSGRPAPARHRARAADPAPGPGRADDGQELLAAAGRSRHPGQLQPASKGRRHPYSESQFKTVKYARSYPGRFVDPEQARTYFRSFFSWYNTQHRHSGLGLLTPEAVYQGRAGRLQAARQRVLEDAYTRHPERLVHGPPQAPELPSEVWINPPLNTVECSPTRH